MGRKPDPAVAKLRQEALHLENEGLSVAQIAQRVHRHRDTVKTWLREDRGGPKQLKTFKADILAHLDSGHTLEQIAARVGCSTFHVRRIERERRGYSKYRSTAAMVEEFIADPEASAHKRFTRYKSFGKALVDRCNQATNTDPKAARELIDMAIRQFSILRAKTRHPEKARLVTCNLVQTKAIAAARQRALRKPEAALEILREVQTSYNECPSCDADLARRESLILRDLMQLPEALDRLKTAQRLYRLMGHSGHDGYNNGLGGCALVEGTLHYLLGNPSAALQVTEHSLQHLVSPSEQALFWRLRFNKVLTLLELPGPPETARRLAEDLLEECGPEASIARMHCVFVIARCIESEGDTGAALNHYEDAYEDALQLEIPEVAAALLADMEKLYPNPISFQNRIDRLRNWRDGKPLSFPSWLRPISSAVASSYQLSKTDIHRALRVLRRESGGNVALPRNAAMAADATRAANATRAAA